MLHTMHGHFGLNKNDTIPYEFYHDGFPSWWILEHKRDYVPFETTINHRIMMNFR